MKRRDFLRLIPGAGLAAGLAPRIKGSPRKKRPHQKFALARSTPTPWDPSPEDIREFQEDIERVALDLRFGSTSDLLRARMRRTNAGLPNPPLRIEEESL